MNIKSNSIYFSPNISTDKLSFKKQLFPYLFNALNHTESFWRNVPNKLVFLCIGSNKCIDDSIGPMTGQMLKMMIVEHNIRTGTRLYNEDNIFIFGTIQSPVHAGNLSSVLKQISNQCGNPYIIAIDASLGAISHIGLVSINNHPLIPGCGVKKKLPPVGDISITGIINASGDFFNTPFDAKDMTTVAAISSFISVSIFETLLDIQKHVTFSNKPEFAHPF
jgi:putative sporulation protein YyaC